MKPRQRILNPLQQLLSLRKHDPAGEGAVRRDRLEWVTAIRATPVSRSYRVKLQQTIGGHPRIQVLAPSLKELAVGMEIPHLYDQEKEVLCLYFPAAADFDGTKTVATQILPWAAMWFYYFEDWLVTGEWAGGGIHPGGGRRVAA